MALRAGGQLEQVRALVRRPAARLAGYPAPAGVWASAGDAEHMGESGVGHVPDAAEPDEARSYIRAELLVLRDQMLSADPDFKRKSLQQLNSEALQFHRDGDDMRCVAAFAKLFRKLRENNVVNRELYVAHSNRAAAYLNLGLYEEALWDARRCAELAELQFARNQQRSAVPSYVKSFARRGFALMGMRLHRLAKAAFEEGLQYDPFCEELKRGLEESTHALLGDLLSGRGRETLALPAPAKRDRIAYLPYSTPLHQVHPSSLLPVSLLTPFQADNDYDMKDTYNYVTVQADIRLPKRHFAILADDARTDAFEAAIKHAIASVQAEDKDVRVLFLGAGSGLLPLLALHHGARHVTAAERWLYLALSCKASLVANGIADDRATVVYKRPTDLALRTDVPVACNVLVCDMLEDGLLSAGLIPACRHALAKLMLPDALVVPAAATVYAQAVQLRVESVCGFDVSAVNLYRWEPAHASGTPLAPGSYIALSEPMRIWHFDMLAPPERSDTSVLDLAFTRAGLLNAILFWYDLHLGGGAVLSTGPGSAVTTLHPALQYLPGELAVEEGMVLGLRCSHNTVRMRFDLEREEYVHVYKEDPSFPKYHFSLLADVARGEAYQAAIVRQVAKRKAEGEVHVLDLGTGSGLLAMMAAQAGADSVVAVDIHEAVATVARRNVAANGLSHRVSVTTRDVGLLERGKEVRQLGCNMVVMDLFDASLLGDHVSQLLALAKSQVLQPSTTVVPAAATVYCMGIEAMTSCVRGFDFKAFNKYRWDSASEAVRLCDMPHRRLTRPKKVFEFFFDGAMKSSAQEGILKLEPVADGIMNAVCFWFDLHLDEEATITTAPEGVIGKGGVTLVLADASGEEAAPGASSPPHYWGQALQYLERSTQVQAGGKKTTILYAVERDKLHFSLREGEGDWVEKPPWKITWGGGASVESPHFQRVHYCELLVREFLMRVRCRRFPPIEKDLKLVLAHCGSLFLDPASLAEVFHELVVLEALHMNPEFSPAATVEAITKRVFALH